MRVSVWVAAISASAAIALSNGAATLELVSAHYGILGSNVNGGGSAARARAAAAAAGNRTSVHRGNATLTRVHFAKITRARMDATRLDHIALGLPRAQAAEELFEGRLGGVSAGGYDGEPFGFRQWEFAGGGRIEVIYPSGPPGGFVQRFLANGGPRVHHVTLKVPSLDAMLARAEQRGFRVVGVSRSDPHWQEAFLHPKQAHGIVVQMVEQREGSDGGDLLPVAKPRADAARIVSLRLSAKSAEVARKQWGELLGGSGFIQGDALIFRWQESPLVIVVDIRPDAEEGALSIELRAPRDLELPNSVYPGLGTRFVQVA